MPDNPFEAESTSTTGRGSEKEAEAHCELLYTTPSSLNPARGTHLPAALALRFSIFLDSPGTLYKKKIEREINLNGKLALLRSPDVYVST